MTETPLFDLAAWTSEQLPPEEQASLCHTIVAAFNCALLDLGVETQDAYPVASLFAERLQAMFGGSQVYFAKSRSNRERDVQIYSEMRGWNVRELARKYGLTDVRIRQICKEIAEQIRNSGKPFPGNPTETAQASTRSAP